MKFLGIELSKKVLIGIICGVVVVGGGATASVILLNNNSNQKQEEKQKESVVLIDSLDVEINSEVSLLSLISEDNKVEITSEDETIDTSTLGEQKLTIKYLDNEEEKEYTFKITIVDTQAPTIEYTKELSTNVGTKIDLLKSVKVSDNSNEEITATIDGDYDFNTEGTYTLKYIAIDSSNNKTEEEFTLNVNKPTCSQKSGSWSTSKPSGCEYTTKTIVWQWSADDHKWSIGYEDIYAFYYEDDAPQDLKPYWSTMPSETYGDEPEHFKNVTIYIIK